MSEPIDHLAWAEAAAEQLDRQVRLDKADSEVVAAQGQLHATIALVEALDRIAELMENDGQPVRHLFVPQPWAQTPGNVDQGRMTKDEPFPGP